jgi:antagonist of KipI
VSARTITVVKPGMLTTVQDAGRWGHHASGVGPTGWMDDVAPRLANALVANREDAAVLECTLLGPTLRLDHDALVAVTGMPMSPALDGVAVPMERPVVVRAGQTLALGGGPLGCRAYVAVSGGIAVPTVLGSASTHLRAGFGGHAGRALRRDDVLRAGPPSPVVDTLLARGDAVPRALLDHVAPDAPVAWHDVALEMPLSVLPAPEFALLHDPDDVWRIPWTVSTRSDRMGTRLDGATVDHVPPSSRASEGTTFGTIQLPPDGTPIVLGADRQVTGGYPVLGHLIAADRWRFAQCRPGQRVDLVPCALDDAQRRKRTLESIVQSSMRRIAESLHAVAHGHDAARRGAPR